MWGAPSIPFPAAFEDRAAFLGDIAAPSKPAGPVVAARIAKEGKTGIDSGAIRSGACMASLDGAAIAQLVEHIIRNDGVGGSNPSCGTN
jgi:hypothetical protein